MTEPRAGVLIRFPREEDLERLASIYNEAVEDGVSNCDLSDVTEAELASWLDLHHGRFPLFVAEVEGEVAGWACLSPFVPKSCFDRTAYTSTYVGKRFRYRGVGLTLREHVIMQARVLGFHTLVNRIFTRNVASLTLTERLGFVRIGLLREVIWRHGEYWDAALYQLILTPNQKASQP
jgi:L-amino acid N-acyltransferase YncA